MRIYLDNAATTPLDPEVFSAMTPYMLNHFGNPSSQHAQGRDARQAIEDSRALIAGLLNASPEEIVFTSGGTEADNTAILSAVEGENIQHVITTRFEHHAVLHTLNALQAQGKIKVSFIQHDEDGNLNLQHLHLLLQHNTRSLVSVMHANNEIGNLNNIEEIGKICSQYSALFHSDTVQTIGHYQFDLEKLNIHFLTASAHKFHGPKGIGFLYCRRGVKLSRLIHGGGQERKLRAGTENIPGIIGLAKAMQLCCLKMKKHTRHIKQLKAYLIQRLICEVPAIRFNGNSAIQHKSLYTVLNASFPLEGYESNLLRFLDEQHISVSGGSACSAGASSHVLSALQAAQDRQHIRFSFSRFNTLDEIDQVIQTLTQLYQGLAA